MTGMETFAFHHIGIAVKDLDAAAASYKTLFNYDLISGPFDDPIQNVSVLFLSRGGGDACLELVAPLQSNSPIDQFLKRGGGPYHICYQVPDLRVALAQLEEDGCFLLSGPVPAIAFDNREIAWVMTNAQLLVELVQA